MGVLIGNDMDNSQGMRVWFIRKWEKKVRKADSQGQWMSTLKQSAGHSGWHTCAVLLKFPRLGPPVAPGTSGMHQSSVELPQAAAHPSQLFLFSPQAVTTHPKGLCHSSIAGSHLLTMLNLSKPSPWKTAREFPCSVCSRKQLHMTQIRLRVNIFFTYNKAGEDPLNSHSSFINDRLNYLFP